MTPRASSQLALLLTVASYPLSAQLRNPRLAGALDQGRLEPGRKLSRITVIFRRTRQQQAALDELLRQQQDPASENYREWLSPDEFGRRFGAGTEDIDRVADWLRAAGLRVESTARGRGWLIASGNAFDAETLFATEIHRYRIRGRDHFAPSTAAVVPPRLQSLIAAVRGLDDLGWESAPRLHSQYTFNDGTHALAPADLANIYGFGFLHARGLRGQGQKIAIVGQSAVDLADLRQFRAQFSLPPAEPQVTLVGDDPGFDRGGDMQEADADLQWAGAAAPDAQLFYVYASDVVEAAREAIDQNLAPVISFSFGGCEPQVPAGDVEDLQAMAQQANAQGITWLASSGDTGAAGCDIGASLASKGLAVLLPASLPEVTGLGGTEFNEAGNEINYWEPPGVNLPGFASALVYIPEKAWNDPSSTGLFASGPGVPDNHARNVPDLAFDSSAAHDPYLVYVDGKLFGFGGTSLAAPLFAGMLALVNQSLPVPDGVAAGLGNINPSLYAMAQKRGPEASPFRDILTGSNIVPCSPGTSDCADGLLGYSAGPGYDQVTGLGSLYVPGFVAGFRMATVTSLETSAASVTQGQAFTLTARVKPAEAAGGPFTGGVVIQTETTGYLVEQTAVDASGTATIATSIPLGTLPAGAHTLTATYSGDSRFGPSTSAPVSITVLPAAPATPLVYYPPNQATGVPLSVTFFFLGDAQNDIYLGTANPPPFWSTQQGAPLSPVSLSPNTKYYWKVVAQNVSGSAESPVWSFTTTPFPGYQISTLAGAGAPGVAAFSGDGGPAINALFAGPYDVASDGSGNIYVADRGNSRIRKIAPDGTISTLAGSGDKTISGDGGPATAAGLGVVYGMAADAKGNVYISAGNRIRMIAQGIITTIAGSDGAGYGGDGGPAADAALYAPTGLTVDASGNLYIADQGNRCIRKISGGTITAVAGRCATSSLIGGPEGGLSADFVFLCPAGVTVENSGTIYVADTCDLRIRKVANGIVTTAAGNGQKASIAATVDTPALQTPLHGPVRVLADNAGNLFFTDPDGFRLNNNQVFRLTNGIVSVVAGDTVIRSYDPPDSGPATAKSLFGRPRASRSDQEGRCTSPIGLPEKSASSLRRPEARSQVPHLVRIAHYVQRPNRAILYLEGRRLHRSLRTVHNHARQAVNRRIAHRKLLAPALARRAHQKPRRAISALEHVQRRRRFAAAVRHDAHVARQQLHEPVQIARARCLDECRQEQRMLRAGLGRPRRDAAWPYLPHMSPCPRRKLPARRFAPL
jgi:hypothetical protein